MRIRLVVYGCMLAYCVLAGVGLAALRAPPWTVLIAALLPVAAQQLYCRVLIGARLRAKLLKLVDPTVSPPRGSYPVESSLPQRLRDLASAKDWEAYIALLADDFALIDAKGRRLDRRMYVRLAKFMDRIVRESRGRIETVVSHPEQPGVLWVREASASKPRFGPGWESTSWTRMTLTGDGARVREIESAVIDVT